MHTQDREEAEPIGPAVAVIGLGYVGLPLALLLARKGYRVLGCDLDSRKVAALQAGRSYIDEISDAEIQEAIASQQFRAADRYLEVEEAEAFILCVPTPLSEQGTPDLSFLTQAATEVGRLVPKGKLIVLESSTYPGTTREVVVPILEQAGLTVGQDVFVAYSPERIDPGNKEFPCDRIPKVVSGVTPACLSRVEALYRHVFPMLHSASSVEVAEMAKILENSYRLINISFINELAMLCDAMRLDIWEVIEAAKTKPFGFSGFQPGPGIGGHCIPVDPIYLEWKLQQYGMTSGFIQLSQRINHRMPVYIANQVLQLLGRPTLQQTKLLVYGAAYKKDIADPRESSALELLRILHSMGADVSYHDPYIPSVKLDDGVWTSVELTPERVSEADAVILITDHSILPIPLLLEHAKLIYDTRNALPSTPAADPQAGTGAKQRATVVRLGGGDSHTGTE